MSNDGSVINQVKSQILTALSHPEAEEGLYFRNFSHLHEEDERPAVEARDEDIFEALHELISEGYVRMNDEGHGEVIFSLSL
jgi:hypothetical protein